MVPAGRDILACTDDQEPLEPVAAEPVQLALESFALSAQATVG
jgi:hypothetical protein